MLKTVFLLATVSILLLIPFSADAKDTYYVYVDELPSWADYAGNVIYDSTKYWEEPNPELKFYVVDDPIDADFRVQWVKEFGVEHVGYAYGKQFLEVGLGDSNCYGKWQPYSANYVNQIMTHEIGHILGLDHSNDVNSIMYPIANNLEYGVVEQEFTLTENYGQFIGLCTVKDVTTLNYWVSTDDPTYGFDVYVVPSVDSFYDWSDGKAFKYYSNEGCFEKNFISFGGTCARVSQGSGLLVIMNSELTNPLTKLTVKMQELAITGSSPQPKVALEEPSIIIKPTYDIVPTIPDYDITFQTPTTTKLIPSLITLSLFSEGKNLGRSYTVEEGVPVQFAGKLTDEKGNPVQSTTVYINDKYDTKFQKRTTTDKDGYYLYYWGVEPNLKKIVNDKTQWNFVATSQVGSKIITSENAFLMVLPPISTKLPDWIKNNAEWWSSGKIDDKDFAGGIEYMIKEKIIRIPQVQTEKEMGTFSVGKIPDWIKNNAKWWSEGKISDDDFSKGIEYMVKEGIIKV